MIAITMTLVFFGNLFIAAIYLAKRYGWFFDASSRTGYYLFFAALTIFMIGGIIAFHNSTSSMGSLLFRGAAILLGFTFYLLLSTIFVDIIRLLIKFKPMYYGLMAISMAVLVSIYGVWNAWNLQTSEINIPIKGLQNSIRAAHLTDTHLGHFRGAKNLEKIVETINQNKVDVVFLTGDLLDGKIQLKGESMLPLQKLKAPVFFVNGNHDGYIGVDVIKAHLRRIGVNVLGNELVNWGELQIIGLNYMMADEESMHTHAPPGGLTIQKVLESMDIDEDMPTILLHHGPDGIKYANEAGVDLYLAGHTHAGQMWPATYIANMIFDYNKGLHDYNGTKLYVCQGTGTFGPPMRIGTKSELTIINLQIAEPHNL